MKYNPLTDPIGQKILQSFGPAYAGWRSLGGIKRATGLSHQQIQSYIQNHPGLFNQPPLWPGGTTPLYSVNLSLKGGYPGSDLKNRINYQRKEKKKDSEVKSNNKNEIDEQ